MAVPQRTLSWLYSALTKDHYDPKQTYHDPNRAYHDVVNALTQYPSLSPRTDVYTYENGFSALLLHLVGTVPAVFRGTTYRFPVAIWIPNTYPREPPMVYVTPPQDMTVRVGQHVTLEGRVYHHYLAHWAEAWDKSTIADFLYILREVFAKEPPVRYRQPMPPQQPQLSQAQAPPPIPPLPPGMGPSPATVQIQSPRPAAQNQTPPQLPPKPGSAPVHQQSPSHVADRYRSPPPLPPLPPKGYDPRRAISTGATTPGSNVPPQFAPSPQYPASQYTGHSVSPLPTGPTYNRHNGINGPQQPPYARQVGPHGPQDPLPQQQIPHQHPSQATSSQYPGYQSQRPLSQQQPPPPPGPPYPQNSPYPSNYPHPPPAAPAPKTQVPDLLTSPFEIGLPSFAPTGPAPPIPPNPEKDALLHAVSRTLAETLGTQAMQSDAAAQSLVSQSHSLQAAMATLQNEVSALNALQASLQSNTTILQQSIHRADATIAGAQARSASVSTSATPSSSAAPGSSDPPSGLPPIDEVLVAPTVVGKQLYDLVAEEEGLQHALYALQAALVRGVIGMDSWSRQTRGLAREAFLKRALISKIGRGMGLETSLSG
ncbi:hypothetical protein N7466_005635 [Penicillium verhagenii]|uniref:uncharacterized protein n=1 Tax=Penicillium verhagenii TaxID=1562060 RepID=UPI0025451605|nr:uncharacterized protein N7466_005635 [Penicillium verhagenii]KAJ5930142.1 hypothetical protein N7466_005635 [Penicillium verhagenii]